VAGRDDTLHKFIDRLLFIEHTVTSDTFLAMMENTALCHVPLGTVFQSDSAPPVVFVPFWTRRVG